MEAQATKRLIDLRDKRFGRLLVVKAKYKTSGRVFYWECVCDCGTKKNIAGRSLRDGVTRSCGCLRSEIARKISPERNKRGAKHGMATTPEYKSWANARQRCENKKNKNYPQYGGRGIRFSSHWHFFINFIEDLGPKPSPELTLERINNDGNYEPSNCRWATRKEQRANQRKTNNGN